MNKPAQLLKRALQLAASAPTWSDFSNALYDPHRGLLTQAFETQDERERFLRTKEYKKICKLLEETIDRTGLVAGATPKTKSRRQVSRSRTAKLALPRVRTQRQ